MNFSVYSLQDKCSHGYIIYTRANNFSKIFNVPVWSGSRFSGSGSHLFVLVRLLPHDHLLFWPQKCTDSGRFGQGFQPGQDFTILICELFCAARTLLYIKAPSFPGPCITICYPVWLFLNVVLWRDGLQAASHDDWTGLRLCCNPSSYTFTFPLTTTALPATATTHDDWPSIIRSPLVCTSTKGCGPWKRSVTVAIH